MQRTPGPIESDPQPAGEVITAPISQRVFEEPWDTIPAFVKRGVTVSVLHEGQIIHKRDIWQRGTWLPIRPFFERRVERAISKANRIVGALAVQSS